MPCLDIEFSDSEFALQQPLQCRNINITLFCQFLYGHACSGLWDIKSYETEILKEGSRERLASCESTRDRTCPGRLQSRLSYLGKEANRTRRTGRTHDVDQSITVNIRYNDTFRQQNNVVILHVSLQRMYRYSKILLSCQAPSLHYNCIG